jgi:hypothetical protein
MVVRVGGTGGKVYQTAVYPRGSDCHCDPRGNLEHLYWKGVRKPKGILPPVTWAHLVQRSSYSEQN